MAIQSAFLLCEHLIAHERRAGLDSGLDSMAAAYAASWNQNFMVRIRASSLFAHLTMRPATAVPLTVLLNNVPSILTMGAAWSGKARPLRRPATVLGEAR